MPRLVLTLLFLTVALSAQQSPTRKSPETIKAEVEAEVIRARLDLAASKRRLANLPDSLEMRKLEAEAQVRAARAEANLAALEQCHDDNCRGVVKIADELAAERARLDWVFHNCKVTSDDFTVHDREDLGVAMKEGAK